jgi:hypothetical protein
MTLLKTVGFEPDGSAIGKRMTAVLSDNTVLMAVVDNNQASVTGDGGDSTGVPKLYVYHSSDRLTFTLKSTVTLAMLSGKIVCSFAVDASNNFHFAYRFSTGQIQYFKGTFAAGPTWSVGSAEQVVTFPGTSGAVDIQYTRIDIDCLGTSTVNPVVAAVVTDTRSASKKVELRCFVRNNSNAWIAQTAQNLVPGDQALSYSEDVSVSANQTVFAGDNMAYFAVSAQRIGSANKDYGGVVYMFKTLVTTGVMQRVDNIHNNYGAGYGDMIRKFWIFNISDKRWVLTGVIDSGTLTGYTFVWDWNTTTNVMTTVVPPTISPGGNGSLTNVSPAARNVWMTCTYSRGTNTFAYYGIGSWSSPPRTRIFSMAGKIDLTTQKVSYQVGNQQFANDYAPSGAPPTALWGGSHPRSVANGQYADIFAFWWKAGTTAVYRVESIMKRQPNAPTAVKPAAAAVASTDRPILQATMAFPVLYAPFRLKEQWQIASDSGFTTNLRTITEPDTDFRYFQVTPPVADEIVDAPGELSQGTWYIRSRSIDEYGWAGAWSTGTSFTVAHKSVGGNLAPNNNQIVIYGSFGAVNFTWKFSDPSPYDFQTAYQITVENAIDNSAVADSGKVTSVLPLGNNDGSGVVNLPTTAKDIPLRWKVVLWDSDDVKGNDSTFATFYVTDAPAPTITSPTFNQVLTTGSPTIAWNPGLAGSKTQTNFRVLITTGAQIAYDTGWAAGADVSYTIPAGFLRNGTSYTVTVSIRDSLGLDASVQSQFSTSWTPPASPQNLAVDPSQLDTRGFIYVSLNPLGYDVDFIAFNLYRRALGTTEWELAVQWTSPSSTYLVYRDFLVGANETYQYTVTQVVERFGDIIESALDTGKIITIKSQSTAYWLIHPTSPADLSVPLHQVTSDDPTEEFEQENYHLLNRGTKVEYGDRLGFSGSLSVQLRDRFLTGKERTNFVLNPAMTRKDADSSAPSRWTTYTAGTVASCLTTIEAPGVPSPTGKLEICKIDIQDIGPATSARAGVLSKISVRDIRVEPLWNGSAYISFWCAETLDSSHATHLRLRTLDTTGTQVTDSGYIAPGLIETNVYGWKRYGLSVALATNVTDIEVSMGVNGTGGATTSDMTLLVGGVQLETGSFTAYFDGNQYGGEWIGTQDDSASRTTGFYTARQQAKALSTLKNERSFLYLRNPFGDIWKIAPGNIGGGRIAGVGVSEFTDVTIPYQEVDF